MAVDTAPAAVPGPDERPGGQQPPATGGFVASLLTPVEPARPLAAMTTTPAGAQPSLSAPESISSAAFHEDLSDAEGNSGNSTKNSAGKTPSGRESSVIRAWLLAGAERWRKGAGANIKRLEVKKAQAAADAAAARSQPKIPAPRQAPAGSASTGGGAGKGPAKSPARTTNSPSSPRNTSSPSPKTPKGPTTPAPAPKQPKAPSTPSKTPTTAPTKQTPAPKPNTPTSHTNPAPSTKAPTTGSSRTTKASDRSDRKTQKSDPSARTSKGKNTGTTPASGERATKGPKNTGAGSSLGPKNKAPKNTRPEAAGKTQAPGRTKTPQPTPATPDKGLTKTTAPKTPAVPKPDAPKPNTSKPDTSKTKPEAKGPSPKKPTSAEKTASVQATMNDRAMFTRDARHTGFRDGYRAGRVAAQARAYRHGVHDGWHAVMTAADDEKTLLDRARALRQEQRKDTPVPTQTTPAPVPPKPTHAPAVPLTVTAINATTLYLGDGAARTTVTRGEVRNLKSFERRLEAQRTEVQLVAEETKGLAWHADQQAAKALQLLEQAKGVKGGEKLLQRLSRLQDDAKAQVALAQELHKQAVRGADATSAVLANTQTRYGPIYQAVVDSDETAPAELHWYQG
uniref:hypothetical protein n=1 Tax=Streptomyces sp. CA-141956 TaxID=3240051 RepID=UPI003F49633F